ncbi:MAG: response regulator transcription factor, partial [Lachnospiraceae bacterium]
MIRTLMIEDDMLLAVALRLLLEENGHQVQAVCTYRETMMQDFSSYDFFCVDIHLPDGNGIDICREIRRAGRQPILVLTAYEDEDYAVRAFEAGADDYVIKPFRSRELVARMSALLRRTCRKPDMKGYRCGGLFVSAESVEVRWQGKPLDVSALEYRILALLLRQAGGRVSRDDMLKQVWQN